MSASTAKTVRRDLRRAMGEEAAGVVDAQTHAIDHLLAVTRAHEQRLRQFHDARLDRPITAITIANDFAGLHDELQMSHAVVQKNASDQIAAFRCMTFRQRLRWLMWGR